MQAYSPYKAFEENWGVHSMKNVKIEIPFSGRLLSSLYYMTDVGSIPRGYKPGETPAPSFYGFPNWKQPIQGCYWCGVDNTSHQEICCSTQCLIYLHEWCVLKVNQSKSTFFLCRYPGCDQNCDEMFYFCGTQHLEAFQEHSISSQLLNPTISDIIQKGPKWYFNGCHQSSPPKQSKKRTSGMKEETSESIDVMMKGTEARLFIFSPRFYEGLIFRTDIGSIPRESKSASHLSSSFANHHNWCVVITGCYWCEKQVIRDNKYIYVCDKKCYSLLHEWCRRKYQIETGDSICPYPGCDDIPLNNDAFCSEKHQQDSENDYKTIYNAVMLSRDSGLNKGPYWYESEMKGTALNSSSESCMNPPFLQQPCIPYLLSRTLTEFLIFQTDIGPIPRELIEYAAVLQIRPHMLQSPSNCNVVIPGCYWCCNSFTNSIYNRIFCSPECFYLFNEWCNRKYRQSAGGYCCKYFSCEAATHSSSNCCHAHAKPYAEEFDKFSSLLLTSQFFLGPKWYNNRSLPEIEFYNRDEPFYEFTNFFHCDSLILDGVSFPTSEHYFQSQKFVGTPYPNYVSMLPAPRDAFDFSRTSEATRWMRPDWIAMREHVMYRVLREKFIQNRELGELLINTCSATLYEHTSNDSFWGDGGNGTGQNKLGQLLMKIRTELQAHSTYFPLTLQHYPYLSQNTDSYKIVQNNLPTSNNTDEWVDDVKPCLNVPLQSNIPIGNISREFTDDQKSSLDNFNFSLKSTSEGCSIQLPHINVPASGENRPPPYNPGFSNQASPGSGSMDCQDETAEESKMDDNTAVGQNVNVFLHK